MLTLLMLISINLRSLSDDDYTIDVLKGAVERKVFTFRIIGHVFRYLHNVWDSTHTHEAMFSYFINY
jgi:hypothetical protein